MKLTVDLRALMASSRSDPTHLSSLASFSYDAKLERTILERWERRHRTRASNGERGPGKDEAHIKAISEALESVSLRGTRAGAGEDGPSTAKTSPPSTAAKKLSPPPRDVPTTTGTAASSSLPPSYPQAAPSSSLGPPTQTNRPESVATPASASELASLYLPDETSERREQFARIWQDTRSLGPPPPTDIEVLWAFLTFEGDAAKATTHLQAYIALKELGFPKDDICTTLLLYNNNQEEALEHLIRGGPK